MHSRIVHGSPDQSSEEHEDVLHFAVSVILKVPTDLFIQPSCKLELADFNSSIHS